MFSVKNIKVVFLVCAVVVSAGLIGGSVLLYTRAIDPQWNPFKPNPNLVMSEAIAKMRDLKSFKASIDYAQRGTGSSAVYLFESFDGKVNYLSDKNNPANVKTAIGLEVNFDADGKKVSLAGETRKVNGNNYLKITTLPILPSLEEEGPSMEDFYYSYFGLDVKKIKSQWIRYSPDSYKELLGALGYGLDAEEEQEADREFKKQLNLAGDIFSKFEQFLKNKEVYLVKNQLPDENANGQKLTRYSFVLNREEAKKLFTQTLGDAGLGMLEGFSGSARSKDSRVMSAISQIRTVAALTFGNSGGYDSFSCLMEDMPALCGEVKKQIGKEPTIFASGSNFCAFSPLTVGGYFYCIDSQGNAQTTNNPQVLGQCDGKTFVCPVETGISKEDREAAVKAQRIQGINNFFDQIGELLIEVSIGKKDGFLHKVKFSKEIDLNRFGDALAGKINLDVAVDFSDFNQDLKIEEPQESQTIAQALVPSVPMVVYPLNNSEFYSIAPSIAFERSLSSNFFVFAFEEGSKTAIAPDSKDWLTWAVRDEFGDTKMKGPVGMLRWNNNYTFFAKACRDEKMTICSAWSEPLYFKITPGDGSFIESDKGEDYYTQGKVIYEQYSKEGVVIKGETIKDRFGAMEDKCLFDYTGNSSDSAILIEYYKTGNSDNPVMLEQYKCPKGCKDGACVEPSLKVVSPNGGESLSLGGIHYIHWQSRLMEGKKIDLSLVGLSSGEYLIAKGLEADENYYNWSLPSEIGYFPENQCFKVKIYFQDKNISDISDNCFSIKKQELESDLSVLNVSILPEERLIGDKFELEVIIKNKGKAKSARTEVGVYEGNASNQVAENILPELMPGEEITMRFTLKDKITNNDVLNSPIPFFVIADSSNKIEESSESDNKWMFYVTFRLRPYMCVESDNGKDFLQKGVIIVYSDDKYISGDKYTDYCSNSMSSITGQESVLYEYYCEEGTLILSNGEEVKGNFKREQMVKCSGGCQDGRCLGEALPPRCIDNDGEDIYTASVAFSEFSSSSASSDLTKESDCCAIGIGNSCGDNKKGPYLREAVCNPNPKIGQSLFDIKFIQCPKGCENGVCVK